MAGYEPGDPGGRRLPSAPSRTRLATRPGASAWRRRALLRWMRRSTRVRGALAAAASLLSDLGHDVVEATPPWADDDVALAFISVWQVGLRSSPSTTSRSSRLSTASSSSGRARPPLRSTGARWRGSRPSPAGWSPSGRASTSCSRPRSRSPRCRSAGSGTRSRARSRSSFATSSSRPSPPSRTSPACRRCRSRCTGPRTSARRRPGHRPARRRCASAPRRAGRGRPAVGDRRPSIS